jgi:hypothetical protein
VSYKGPTGQDYGSDTKPVPAGDSYTFYQGNSGSIPPGSSTASYGSALIESDRPVVAIVNDAVYPGSTKDIDQGVYNAIPLRYPVPPVPTEEVGH